MAGDLARVSYDPSRKWRGLIAQQGRVTVEADWNEAAAIGAEAARQRTLDTVGTLGTPDGGYVVTAIPTAGSPPAGAPPAGSPPASGPGDLIIGPGTLYAGGERLDLDTPIAYSAQPDWLDHSTDPRWSPPAVPAGTGNELVYLLASEQEVSAVEDPALTDVALGGPDTMGRRRILQRFARWPSPSAVGYQAWDAFVASLGGEGLTFDPATMTLGSATSLLVSFTSTGSAGPCQPTATGGYLGAENQMIRVMVTGVSASGAVTFAWGFDDASFLYRVQAAAYDAGAGTTTVTLASAPPDSYHFPVTGQAVELLRNAVQLTAADYIASPAGFVAPLSTGFAPASMSLALTGEPPADYLSTATSQLYLRVWQGTASATPGQPVPLSDTGIQVTLTSSTGAFHPGDFWRFAVRPVQPTTVYPERYLTTSQPPEGPRTVACPIAVLSWNDGAATATSTVPVFASLTRQAGGGGGCCTVSVGPADVDGGATLQALLNKYATQSPVTICLQPGTYTLPAPLLLGAQSNGLTLQGGQGGVVFQAPSSPSAAFAAGLVTLQGVSSVTIRGIEFSLPLAAYPVSTSVFRGLPGISPQVLGAFSTGLQVAIGISVDGSAGLSVEDCLFSLGTLGQANVLSAGISATGTMTGTTIKGCTFQCTSPPATIPYNEISITSTWPSALPPYQLMFGYLQTGNAATKPGAAQLPAQLLDEAAFEENQFLGITVPALALAQLGALRVERNTVQACYGGFWLISLTSPNQQVLFLHTPYQNAGQNVVQVYGTVAEAGLAPLADVVFALATGFGWALPAPSGAAAGTGTAPAVPLRLDVSGNQIDTSLASPYSGAGLIVADFTTGGGTAIVNGNRISSRLPMGAAALVGAGAASVTGNLVLNEVPALVTTGADVVVNSYSLVLNPASSNAASILDPVNTSSQPVWLSPAGTTFGDLAGVPAVAVTGNVFVNPTLLPARPGSTLTAPLNDWDTFNTVFNYGIGSPPTVAAVSPTTAPSGTKVTVTGSGFTGATAVSFGRTPAITFTVVNDSNLSATVPPGSGTVDLTVSTSAGTSAAVPADEFTFLTSTGVSPSSGQPPLTVIVTGSGFVAGETAVSFGTVAGTGVTVAPGGTQLAVQLPSGTGVVDVTITVAGVSLPAVASEQFTYLEATQLNLTGGEAFANQTITAVGVGFIPGQTTVTFTSTDGTGQVYSVSGQAVTVNSTGTSLSFVLPIPATAVPGSAWIVVIKTPYGTAAVPQGVGELSLLFGG